MNLSRRLSLLASLVPNGDTVYDIGCDHALLDIFLTLYNNNTCYAIDISKSALEMAKKNVIKYHLEDKIHILCNDGINGIPIIENSTMVIAGMGSLTILEILESNQDKFKRIIIQTNKDYYLLRKTMTKKQYKIKEEYVLKDKNIFYVIIVFEKGNISYSKKELEYGPCMLKESSEDVIMYYEYLLNKKKDILKKMPRGNLDKKIKLKKDILWLKKTLKIKEKM
jgi:tRNA (adenine22-N1)-methyltransferase